MHDIPAVLQAELLVRLLLAVLLGSVLGMERQTRGQPAGLRTHILVSLGAAAFTIAGVYGVAGLGTVQDPGRVAAQIVTGIGFLGAGTIWRSSGDRMVYGLTTAASIWVAASIGMLSGFGLYVLAAGCALISFTVLRLLKGLEQAPVVLRRFMARKQAPAARATLGTTAHLPDAPAEAGASLEATASDDTAAANVVEAGRAKPKRLRKKDRKKRKRRGASYEDVDHVSDTSPAS